MSWEVFDPRQHRVFTRKLANLPTSQSDLNANIKRAMRMALAESGERQKDFANRVGIAPSYLNRVLRQEQDLNVPKKLLEILDALDLELVVQARDGS